MKRIIKDRKGSALVTVIIVIAYISILATTILYVSGVNYQMKTVDNKTKESFYSGEIAIDTIRADMVKYVEKTVEGIYPFMMSRIGACTSSAEAQVLFETEFYNKMRTYATTYVGAMPSPISSSSPSGFLATPEIKMVAGHLEIQNIQTKYTHTNGTVSYVRTNIVINIPDVQWPYQVAAQTIVAGDTQKDCTIDYFDCVYYSNWVKE